MGGIGRAIKKVSLEDAVSMSLGDFGASKAIKSATGVNVKDMMSFGGTVLAREVYDKPQAKKKKAKADAKAAEAEAKKETEAAAKEFEGRAVQEEAESEAATDFERSKRRQRRRASKSKGRSSTILTDGLGSTGGDNAKGRTTLLGL